METATIELTKEEAQLVADCLQKSPFTGNMQTLPRLVVNISNILGKLQAAFTKEEQPA